MSREGRAAGARKTTVTCKTCGVTNSFYSTIGVKQFGLQHTGHEVVEFESKAPEGWRDEGAVTEERGPLQKPGAVKVTQVVVELLKFPALTKPVFRIRGINEDKEEAFVQVLVQEQAERVREVLARGELTDQGPDGQLYTWDPGAIEFTDEAKRSLRLPARAAAPMPAGRTTKPVLESPPHVEVEDPDDRVFPFARGPRSREAEFVDTARTLNEPGPGVHSTQEPEGAPSEPSQRTAEPELEAAEKMEEAAPRKPADATSEAEAEAPLLVSKSWYVQEGKKNEKEAARISKVLRAFRWKIEPAYTIRLIVDDILSVESSKNEISGALMKRIESAGYRLSAVTAEQGSLVAWFKRVPDSSSPTDEADEKGRAARGQRKGPDAKRSRMLQVPGRGEVGEPTRALEDGVDL